ncbi:3-oxoacyl-ACP synthase, partial [Neisseria arctica]
QGGISPITRLVISELIGQVSWEIKDIITGCVFMAKEARRMDVIIHYGIADALQAVADAGLDDFEGLAKYRVGVNIGSGNGGG